MAEPVLNEPCVMTRVGQGIAAGVAQHVSMDPKRQLGALANGFHEAVDGVRRERTPALILEDERTRRIPLQLAQHAQFITPDRMNCGACRSSPCGRAAPDCDPIRPETPPTAKPEYLTPWLNLRIRHAQRF